MDPQQALIAKLQRKAERQGAHLLGLIDAAARKEHEIRKLEGRMLSIYKSADNPRAVRAIIEKTIPRALEKMRARDDG